MSENTSQGNSSSKKILQAAVDEFTENGFEGARVARIAKKAGVSQALLYYIFKSKQGLMDAILNQFFDSNIDQFTDVFPSAQEALEQGITLKDELRKSLEFILKNHKEVKILLMQALLDSHRDKRILTMLNDLNQTIRKNALNNLGYNLEKDHHLNQQVIDYFCVFIPFIMFGLLGKEWGQVNHISIEEIKDTLIEVTDSIYSTYLK